MSGLRQRNADPASGRHPDHCDVAVIGAGMAGMAAALFCSRRGLSTVQVGNAGGLLFSSGPLDLLGVHPLGRRETWDDPWAALELLRRDLPRHPYARMPAEQMQMAMEEFVAALGEVGLTYSTPGQQNSRFLTALGTIKTTHSLPRGMEAGVDALSTQPPGLLVDFEGLREFSAQQVASTAAASWPGLRVSRISFPGREQRGETHAALLARSLELRDRCEALADRIRPHLHGTRVVGLPAVLGVWRTGEILDQLQQSLGVSIFEIPTMPTSVPGLRLKEALERVVSRGGVHRMVQASVEAIRPGGGSGGGFELDVRGSVLEHTLEARAVVLATGRFMGGGLTADRDRVRETILDLPVFQPQSRAEWHRHDFYDPAGHPVNMAGVEVDDRFRALDRSGEPAHARLYAVGSLLAHQDWMRQKCGAGLAITTAHAAVSAACEQLGGGSSAVGSGSGAPARATEESGKGDRS